MKVTDYVPRQNGSRLTWNSAWIKTGWSTCSLWYFFNPSCQKAEWRTTRSSRPGPAIFWCIFKNWFVCFSLKQKNIFCLLFKSERQSLGYDSSLVLAVFCSWNAPQTVVIQLGLCLKSRLYLTLLSCQNLKVLAKNHGVGDLSARIREIPREKQYSTESPVRYHSSSPLHTIAAWLWSEMTPLITPHWTHISLLCR